MSAADKGYTAVPPALNSCFFFQPESLITHYFNTGMTGDPLKSNIKALDFKSGHAERQFQEQWVGPFASYHVLAPGVFNNINECVNMRDVSSCVCSFLLTLRPLKLLRTSGGA